jgi:pimeloyl-ACP methyl ester carboxylesterase
MRTYVTKKLVPLRPGHALECQIYEPVHVTPETETILFLNGSIFNLLQWKKLLRAFLHATKDYRLICYNYSRTGHSIRPDPHWSLPALADEALALLDALQIPAVHLYGMSKGTMVAQFIALRAQNRILSVAGYGWFNGNFSQMETLNRHFARRLERFSALSVANDAPLERTTFKNLWEKVYRFIVFRKEKLYPHEWLLDRYLQYKLYPLLAPTSIRAMHEWFLYIVSEFPNLKPAFQAAISALATKPLFIQHAEHDETLPAGMARELKSILSAAHYIEYSTPFSHMSPPLRRRHAKVIMGDYVRWIRAV